MSVEAKEPMALRAIRVDQNLWVQALLAAAGRGESVSVVVRRALRAYVDSYAQG